MQFSTLLFPMAFTLAAAQYNYGSDSSSTADSSSVTSSAAPTTFTSTSGVVTHKIAVGKTALSFTPNTIQAAVGDALEFHFYPNTHSVAVSTFAKPCAPVDANSFWSGGFVTSSGMNATVFTVNVTSTASMWLYCGFPKHCQGGMVAVVNPPTDTAKTLDLYKKAAALTSNTTVPAKAQGGVKGAAASTASSSDSSSTTPSGTSSTTSPTATPNEAPAMGATMGVVAGFLSLAFAGLIL